MDNSINKIVLLIGAGQLGSRHLQGLLKINGHKVIYVLDPSQNSLLIAKERSFEIEHGHELFFVEDWENIPFELGLVIIATNSNIRESIIKKLILNYKVTYLILEKVLFPNLEAYPEIGDLLRENKIQTWVNHPRRIFAQYQKIRSIISQTDEQIFFNVIGGNWGLACNGLHFLDLFKYLTNSEIETINGDFLGNEIFDSKRKGFIEINGLIQGNSKRGSFFQISSFDGVSSPIIISITSKSNHWLIKEKNLAKIFHISDNLNNGCNEEIVEMPLQSNLTTVICESIFETNDCKLPTYEEAKSTHEKFICTILKKYNNLKNSNSNYCPIT